MALSVSYTGVSCVVLDVFSKKTQLTARVSSSEKTYLKETSGTHEAIPILPAKPVPAVPSNENARFRCAGLSSCAKRKRARGRRPLSRKRTVATFPGK